MTVRRLLVLVLLLPFTLFGQSLASAESSLSIPKTIYLCSESKEVSGIVPDVKPRRCLKKDEYPSIWHLSESLPQDIPNRLNLVACTSKDPNRKYFHIKSECRKFQKANYYSRSTISPVDAPVISGISNISRTSVDLELRLPSTNPDAPVRFLEISVISGSKNDQRLIEADGNSPIRIDLLSPNTSYSFKVRYLTIDGSSPESSASEEIRTLMPAPPAPLFTLSSSAETATVGFAMTGFSINQSGGPVDSLTISPEIESSTGIIFDPVAGTLTGTPNSTMSETIYTITGTNESGSHSETFTLTVKELTAGPTAVTFGTFFVLAILIFVWLLYQRRRPAFSV